MFCVGAHKDAIGLTKELLGCFILTNVCMGGNGNIARRADIMRAGFGSKEHKLLTFATVAFAVLWFINR
jgi:hypothetical protein